MFVIKEMNHLSSTVVIKRYYQSFFSLVILLVLILYLQPIAYGAEPLSPEESMKQIERSLERFNRDSAYEQMHCLLKRIICFTNLKQRVETC